MRPGDDDVPVRSADLREREVIVLVVAVLLNKQIAQAIGVMEQTVQTYRGQVMRKMRARSGAELVRLTGYGSLTQRRKRHRPRSNNLAPSVEGIQNARVIERLRSM